MRAKLKKYQNVIYPTFAAAIMLLVWWLVAKSVNSEIILPPPKDAFLELISLLKSPRFWTAMFGTTFRAVRSFLYATAIAAFLSVLSNRFNWVEKLAEPIVTTLRSVPTMSIILIALLWISSQKSPMLIAFLITFPMLYNHFLSSLKGVDKKLVEMSKVFKVGGFDKITKLYIPSVLPSAFDAMKNAVSLSLKVTIASEVMAHTSKSLGVYMQQSMIDFDMATLLAYTISAVLFSYLLELIVLGVKKLVVRW